MNPEIISAIITSAATLVVGVPTFIALVIAIRELRESARQNKVAVYQKTVDTEHNIFRMIAKDPDLLRLCVGTDVKIPQDTNKRDGQLGIVFLFDFYERIYYEHHIGAFPEELWAGWKDHIIYVINDPEVAELWDVLKNDYFSHFREFVERNRVDYKSR